MEHFYNNIQGWFSFPKLYTEMVNRFNNGSKFAEIGTWKGTSAAYMAVEIANSKKDIEFYCVDLWSSVANHTPGAPISSDDSFYEEFLTNVASVRDYIKPVRMNSVDAANSFEDSFFDFIFIDASHDYESVKTDLNAWFPKLKPTGVFAGHDYHRGWPGVQRAVDEFCASKNLIVGSQEDCWAVRVI